MKASILAAWLTSVAALLGGCASTPSNELLLLEEQGSFFVGGKSIPSDSLVSVTPFPSSGTITSHQMYVRYQRPPRAKAPVVLIHGCCLTGKTWESTPDGRAGWDELFVRAGHPTYVVDQVLRGRSAVNTSSVVAAKTGAKPASTIDPIFFASHEAAWETFRFGPKFPQAYPDTQFPVEHVDEFWKQMVPDWSFAFGGPDVQSGVSNPNIDNLTLLTRRIGPAIFVSHSQSGVFPFNVARLNPQGVAAIVAVEPFQCPSPQSSMEPFRNVPVLIVWGAHNETSAFWGPRMRACQEFAEAAAKSGVNAKLVLLGDVGFPGASHMLMQDKNSHAIARWLAQWMAKEVRAVH